MKLFIAEKPELGRAIAEALSGTSQNNKTHIIKSDSIITWAFGHILKLAKPEDYNEAYKQWTLSSLPFALPYPFKRIPLPNAQSQLKTIIGLMNKSEVTEIVHCGDADEEGQILIDEILEYARTNKPVMRCLINDITPKAIQKAMSCMQPNSNFRGLSQSGFARSDADFIVGLNFTRFYTCLNSKNGGEGLISIGRVQTPILALIVNRELENKNFKSLEYFALSGEFHLNNQTIQANLKQKEEDRITDKEIAENLKAELENQTFSFSIKSQDKEETPPLPFNLLNLQAEASRLYGFSAKKTMDITQDLREKHKAITYNRSDCEYLPTSLYEESPQIIESLKNNFKEEIGQSFANTSIKSKAFDDSKISAHYAIIPTQSKLELDNLTQEQKLIYTLIAKRFLMQFYPPCKYKAYCLEVKLGDYTFSTSFRVDTHLGFKEYFSNKSKDEEETQGETQGEDAAELKEDSLSFLESLKSLNQSLCKTIKLNPTKTKPRPLYTMTTLLKDLNQVGKYVKDSKIKKLLIEKDKDKKGENGGIGTPATRSQHIETLIQREYISVSKDKKQSIKVNPKGFKLIENLPAILSGVDMTALWFEQQKEIQKGSLSKEEFLKGIHAFIASLIKENKESKMSVNQADHQENKEQLKCPKCENGILREINGKYGKFFSCSNYQNGCDYRANSVKGKPVEKKPKEISKEYPCPECKDTLGGFLQKKNGTSKAGKPYIWWGCSEFKNGCKFSCFDKEGKPNLESSNENG